MRQIAWLASLVMVPSAPLSLRRRKYPLVAGVLVLSTVVFVVAMMHWFSVQPYAVPDRLFEQGVSGRRGSGNRAQCGESYARIRTLI